MDRSREPWIAVSAPEPVDEVRRQMAKLRADLHQDMRGVVAGAEAATDWRYYVRQYPWPCLAVAFAAGFLVVPRRRRSIRATAEAAATAAVEKVKDGGAEPVYSQVAVKSKSRPGLFRMALAFVAPVALRAAQSYAAQFVETFLTAQSVGGPPPPSEPKYKSGKP
jgi:hypothetical protein